MDHYLPLVEGQEDTVRARDWDVGVGAKSNSISIKFLIVFKSKEDGSLLFCSSIFNSNKKK